MTYEPVQELNEFDRVRANTAASVNAKIDRELFHRLVVYSALSHEDIGWRIRELEKEWDIERAIDLQASVTALLGLWMAHQHHWKWIWLTVINQIFLLQHSLQGWCPPVALQRSLKQRTRREINFEILALRLLRGDFGDVIADGDPVARAQMAVRLAAAR